jgi:transcription elongation factor Elf1
LAIVVKVDKNVITDIITKGEKMPDNNKGNSEVIRIADVELIKGLKKTGTCPKCGKAYALDQYSGSKKVKNIEDPEWLDFYCKLCGKQFKINKSLYSSV